MCQTLPAPVRSDTFLCQFQAFIINYTSLCTITWSNVISGSLVMTCLYDIKKIKSYEKYFHMFTHLVATVLSFIPVFADVYSKTDADYCWINEKQSNTHFVFMFICYYGPIWLTIVFIFVSYIRVISYLKSLPAYRGTFSNKDNDGYQNMDSMEISSEEPQEVKTLKRLIYYPGAMLICVLFPTVKRIYSLSSDESSFPLALLSTLFGDLQGFFNAVIYGLNSSVKETIKNNLRNCVFLPCFKRKKRLKKPSSKKVSFSERVQEPTVSKFDINGPISIPQFSGNIVMDPDDEPSDLDEEDEQGEQIEEAEENCDGDNTSPNRRGTHSSSGKQGMDPNDIYFLNSMD